MQRFPEAPERDVLGFLMAQAPLKRWQLEVIAIVRDEAYYFAPQGQTKIMNEGWATYWHTKMMTSDLLEPSEVIDYCDHTSGTTATAPGQLNPYKLGLELWRHIEERWDHGRHGKAWLDCLDPEARKRWDTGERGKGREKIFEVRRTHNDVTFLDTFLTAEFCAQQGLFTTRQDARSGQWLIDSHEFDQIKTQLLHTLATRGSPRVYVVDANHGNRGELALRHDHEGQDIKLEWAEVALGNLARIWARPVVLETHLDGKPAALLHDGDEMKREGRGEAG